MNPAKLTEQDLENEDGSENIEEALERTTNSNTVPLAVEQTSISRNPKERAPSEIIAIYLLDRVGVFRDLAALRAKVSTICDLTDTLY